MTKKELHELTFQEAVEKLYGKVDGLTTYENLKEFAIHQIESENIFLAIHILEAIRYDFADYYDYDYSMGTLETPTSVKTIEDLEYYLD